MWWQIHCRGTPTQQNDKGCNWGDSCVRYDRYLRVIAALLIMFVLVNHHTQCTRTFSQNASKAVCARAGTAFGAKAVVAASGRSKAAANLMVDWLVCSFLLGVACHCVSSRSVMKIFPYMYRRRYLFNPIDDQNPTRTIIYLTAGRNPK